MSNGIQRKLDIVEKKIGQASKNDLAELGQNVSVNQTVGASPNLTFQKYKENVEKILLRSTLKNRQKKITQQNSKIMKLNAEVEQLIEQNEKKSLDIEVKETELTQEMYDYWLNEEYGYVVHLSNNHPSLEEYGYVPRKDSKLIRSFRLHHDVKDTVIPLQIIWENASNIHN